MPHVKKQAGFELNNWRGKAKCQTPHVACLPPLHKKHFGLGMARKTLYRVVFFIPFVKKN